ncbi:hypothetical protein [Oryza sativa Japonica Group]|uniref:Uncharacterized protein n=1 Tax=Oryza sativa subsp. japonica TaxID=39947 RepID=Q5NAR2_ORYSJ|nr:hypothetical protein [Oryza sativa Japonica Group]
MGVAGNSTSTFLALAAAAASDLGEVTSRSRRGGGGHLGRRGGRARQGRRRPRGRRARQRPNPQPPPTHKRAVGRRRCTPAPRHLVAFAAARLPDPDSGVQPLLAVASSSSRARFCSRRSGAARAVAGGRCPRRLGFESPRLSTSDPTPALRRHRSSKKKKNVASPTTMRSYEPGPAFEENSEEAMLDISQTESTELWLIQWPLNQLDASDFHGQELTLKLHRDGKLSSLESSSGKSYDLVSFAAQQPDATVFLPSGPEAKAVGKIARRVSLVRYPDPEELEKPGLGSLTPSSKKSAGSSKKTRSRFTSGSKNRSSQGSAQSLGQQSAEPAHKHNQKRKDESSLGHSNVSGKSAEGSQVRGGDSGTTSEVPQTPVEKSKKKNKKLDRPWKRRTPYDRHKTAQELDRTAVVDSSLYKSPPKPYQ